MFMWKVSFQTGLQPIHYAANAKILDLLVNAYGCDPHAKVSY